MPTASAEQTRLPRRIVRRTTVLLGAAVAAAGLVTLAPAEAGAGAAGAALPATIAAMSPAPGQTVGVAHPVTVTFAGSVPDRRAVEQSFTVHPAGTDIKTEITLSVLPDQEPTARGIPQRAARSLDHPVA